MVAKIVAAAASIVRGEKAAMLTTDRIANVADVSKGSIYQYFANKHEIIEAAIALIAAEEAKQIEALLQSVAANTPDSMMDSAIDILIDYTVRNRNLIRFLAHDTDRTRIFFESSGMYTTLLAMSTLNANHHRNHYRPELTPRAAAWIFLNMATATTLRYVEDDEPIPLDQLRHGLKGAAAGLLTIDTRSAPHGDKTAGS
ncbi:TetR family transcriptional regulator [Mycolicibacterium conceptionense]|uniref:TetR family transcriptional regulator n=2 Tax=Mycolicibacterium conceptionense TaxID=451644 RepID=A0ABX3V508_9MYCO|nr:TetR/AcrR family transcriptional regulator [Mycolicibacterium conceptionense]ORV24624.1 TetR family transcriptional regulator [Mycolicibacterium conceptionense]